MVSRCLQAPQKRARRLFFPSFMSQLFWLCSPEIQGTRTLRHDPQMEPEVQ